MPFARLTVLQAMLQLGFVPTFTPLDLAAGCRVVQACRDGGSTVVEVTNRSTGTLAVFRELVAWSELHCPEVMLGAGTIYDAPTAAMFIDAGASFIVSPVLNADVARLCNRRRVAFLPGCSTATEISAAEELGAEIVKFFPAAAFDGPAFVKGILGPSPSSRIMPTNIAATEQSVHSWFGAGVACVGVGPALVSDDLQQDATTDQLTGRVAEFAAWVRAARD